MIKVDLPGGKSIFVVVFLLRFCCVGFAGAEASAKVSPPTSPRSSEDSLGPRAQLRLTFARRRRANHRNRNSVEEPAHRRRAPAPIRVGFAGAAASAKLSPPTSPRSSEDSLGPFAQLRPTAGNRRRANHRNRNSVEEPAHRRRAPAPIRVGFAGAAASAKTVTSDEPSFVGGQPRSIRPAPANSR